MVSKSTVSQTSQKTEPRRVLTPEEKERVFAFITKFMEDYDDKSALVLLSAIVAIVSVLCWHEVDGEIRRARQLADAIHIDILRALAGLANERS
jgi:hypothetical protein